MKCLLLAPLLPFALSVSAQTTPSKKPTSPEVERMIAEAKANTRIIIPPSKSPGIGPNPGIPTGTPLQLPPCIRLVNRKNKPFDPDLKKLMGFSRTFYVDISFVNDCTQAIDLELPQGLILNSQFRDNQNGLLVERVLVEVPPSRKGGGKTDTTTIYLAVACLNKKLSPPMSEANPDYPINVGSYTVGKVTDDPGLQQMLAVLKGIPKLAVKKHSLLTVEEMELTPQDKMYSEIQLAIYKITDEGGMSQGDVQKLKKQLEAYR